MASQPRDRVPTTGFDQLNAQQVADSQRVSRSTAALAASRRASLRSRAGQWEPSAEPLACPACKTEYDFGDACPDCDVDLVGVSVVHLFEPAKTPFGVLLASLRARFGIRALYDIDD